MNDNRILNISRKMFSDFKNKIKDVVDELICIRNTEKEKTKKNFLDLGNEVDLYYEFIFFMNYKRFIVLNIDFNYHLNENIIIEFNKIKVKDNKAQINQELYKILLHMHIFFLAIIENNIEKITINLEDINIKNFGIKEINISYQILIQIFFLLLKFYKQNIYDVSQILLFFDIFIIFIRKMKSNEDRYVRLKNIILFQLLFEKYFGYFIDLLSNNPEIKSDDINLFFNYIINFLKRKELNETFSFQILTKNNIISNFVSKLLNFIDCNNNINIYNKYKDEFINCFVDIYKNNTTKSGFFEALINQNKISFNNLVNYKTRKDYVITDIYKQAFNIKLLFKLFSIEKNNNTIDFKNENNFFIFNGQNSKMTFKLNEFSLNNTILFFSFKFLENISNIFPLICFEQESGKEIIFKLYIQKDNNINKLYIYQEKKENKKKKICLDKFGNIFPYIQYFIAIIFQNKKVQIYITSSYEINHEEIEIYDIDNKNNKSPILKLGHDDKNNEFFKGYIDSFIGLRNLSLKKNCNLEIIVEKIFNLKNLYIFFPLFLSRSSFYHFDEKIYFSSIQEENNFNDIKNFLQNNIEKFQFEFYFTPEIFGLYYSLFYKKENNNNFFLPEIPSLNIDYKYKIIDMNISLIKHNSIYADFLRNNGLDYFILIYEYIYHFFKLSESEKEDFKYFLCNENLNKNFIKIIQSTLLILFNTYTYYKYIILYPQKYKTLFRNLHEILKFKNNNIFNNIYYELYMLFFDFLNEYEKHKNDICDNIDNKTLSNKDILPFFSGLIDIIFDIDLYINNKDDNNLKVLFNLTKKMIMENNNNNSNEIIKQFPFEQGFIFKLLNFIKVLDKEFTEDIINKNDIIITFFDLLKVYIEINETYSQQLFIFVLNNYKENLNIILNFLDFRYEIFCNNYSFSNKELELLLNLYSHQKNEEKNNNIINNKLIEEINSLIFKILLKLSLTYNSDEILQKLNSEFKVIVNSEIIFSNIISEIIKISDSILIYDNFENNGLKYKLNFEINYMDMFEKLFNIIIDLFNASVNDNNNNENSSKDKIENSKFLKLFNLLAHLTKTTDKELKKNKQNINCLYCLINYIKFYYKMIFVENKILLFSELIFIKNLIDIIEICNKSCLINCITTFKLTFGVSEYHKTIIELIYEICIKYFLNDENSEKSYSILLENLNFIFYDRQFLDNKKYSIFYVNDNLNYYITKNKYKKLDASLKNKCIVLLFFKNELFINEEEFNGNFSTYFLPIIIDSLKKINNQKTFKLAPISKLSNFLNDLFSFVVNEHINLYNIDKKYFFRTISSSNYNEIINFIKNKVNHKKAQIDADEIKKNIESIIPEKSDKRKSKAIIINKENTKQKNKLAIFEQYEEPKINNNIHFFYDIDRYYITNIKKSIMNCIFSLYYLDEFFYSNDFCIIKKYYTNNYLNKLESIDSKKLNFPSIIKNFRNNFEPPLFIKKFNNYVIDPYFSITHSYTKNEFLKKYLNKEKSIKLYEKEFYYLENDKQMECELLKNDSPFYGKLYFNDTKNYLLFKEEEKNFKDEEGYNHIFFLSYIKQNDKATKEPERFKKKKYTKNIMILFDDIEEIIEIRIMLLWKGFEIYLKNGKSYLFNFSTTKEYNYFIDNFIMKSRLKNLIKKRDFLTDKSNISQNWRNYLLSNYDYLLILNRYGSRSFNDPTQYPIFPWLLNNYKEIQSFNDNEKFYLEIKEEYMKIKEDKKNKINTPNTSKTNQFDYKFIESFKLLIQDNLSDKDKFTTIKSIDFNNYIKKAEKKIRNILRNFKYPPSFQNEINRTDAKKRFDEAVKCNINFPSHSGCHYSNLGYIYYFLMRQQPYDNLLVKLQAYNLENPNRIFGDIISLQTVIQLGTDNRELIPEFFSKIEYFLNLNCDLYGIIDIDKNIIDDCELKDIINNNNNQIKSYLSKYVNFIIIHKKLLNSKLIGFNLKNWIDNIFGINQLPPENERKESCNIFQKLSYEQKINLEEKLNKKISKNNLTENQIKKKLIGKIEYIINFGVTPSLLFHEAQPKLKWTIIKKKEKEEEKDENEKIEVEQDEDLYSILEESITEHKLSRPTNGIPIIFKINPTINKVFIYNKEDNLMIVECQLFNEINCKDIFYYNYNEIKKLNILYTKENSEYQIKYSFSSFENKINYYNDIDTESYHTYYYNKINLYTSYDKILSKYNNNNFSQIIIITCRHIDFSFKIHYLEKENNKKNKNKKNEIERKIYSYICEDFVTSCCCLTNNAFIIGLNNGKLIYFIIKENPTFNKTKKISEQKDNIKIEKQMYIQAHNGKINIIEIDKRLGIVITSGDDNYIFIRKLYDFELLLPIQMKTKYSILMTKISSYNFLYVLCFNKANNQKIIFGYTLSGIKFAKSEYGFYDNINFTRDGNVLTMNNKKDLTILSGSDLRKLNNIDDNETIKIINEIKYTNWIQYDYFLRGKDEEFNEILTFFENKERKNIIRSINVSNL